MDDLKKLSNDLKIDFNPAQQDWGIENADSERLVEFIDYYRSNELPGFQKCWMFELIMESANLAIENKQFSSAKPAFFNFLENHFYDVPEEERDYWLKLGEEFPISQILAEFHEKV